MGRHEGTVALAPSSLGKRNPILRCELRELRVEPPAQDFPTLLEGARHGELSHIVLDPHQALQLDDGTDVVQDNTRDRGRR